jgi:hypothetical protein
MVLLANESILNIYEIKNCGRNYAPFWDNGLVVIPKKISSSSNYYPHILWGPYQDSSPTGYHIFRKYGSGSWVHISTVNNDVFSYTDTQLTVAQLVAGTTTLYKVRAYMSGF